MYQYILADAGGMQIFPAVEGIFSICGEGKGLHNLGIYTGT